MTNTNTLPVVSPVAFVADFRGITSERTTFAIASERFVACRWNGGAVEIYRVEEGLEMFVSYANPAHALDAFVVEKFAAAARVRARMASECERPLELS